MVLQPPKPQRLDPTEVCFSPCCSLTQVSEWRKISLLYKVIQASRLLQNDGFTVPWDLGLIHWILSVWKTGKGEERNLENNALCTKV